MFERLPRSWPVIVIGGGPAGSSAAITIAKLGLKVLLVDAKAFPRRKVCGGCLNQVSARLLKELLAPSAPLWDASVRLGAFELTHRQRLFRFPMPDGLAVERAEMDQALVDSAVAFGVTFLAPATAKIGRLDANARQVRLESNGQSVHLSAQVVIVACGLGNRSSFDKSLPDLLALQQSSTSASRVGVEVILDEPEADYLAGAIHMIVARDGYVGLTRIANARLHVAAAVNRGALQRLGPQSLIEAILQEAGAPRLKSAEAGLWRGTPPLTARADCLAAERIFLVGDAAGYVEPFTGEGIRWALESGMAVGPFAIKAHDRWTPTLIDEWEAWYRNVIGIEQQLCRRITSALKRPALRFIAHQALWLRPSFASKVIARLNSESSS
jgi:menaquinone-9 beta-reductase